MCRYFRAESNSRELTEKQKSPEGFVRLSFLLCSASQVAHTVEQYGNLWLHIFAHMELLSSDPRPEVRNCAVRTLFSTLSTHGGVLVPDTWQALIFGVRFRRLRRLRFDPEPGV